MNIYVGYLARHVTNDILKKAFEPYGEVESARVIMDHATGQSRGFGFVIMNNDEEANTAIQSLNGQELEGQKLRVNEARPMEERSPRTFNRDRSSGTGDSEFSRRPQREGGFERSNSSGPKRGGFGSDRRKSY